MVIIVIIIIIIFLRAPSLSALYFAWCCRCQCAYERLKKEKKRKSEKQQQQTAISCSNERNNDTKIYMRAFFVDYYVYIIMCIFFVLRFPKGRKFKGAEWEREKEKEVFALLIGLPHKHLQRMTNMNEHNKQQNKSKKIAHDGNNKASIKRAAQPKHEKHTPKICQWGTTFDLIFG